MTRKEIKNSQVANKLKKIRKKKSLTQGRFAKLLDVSESALKGYEVGRVPHPTILSRYADLGETSVDWILGRTKIDAPLPQKHEFLDQLQNEMGRYQTGGNGENGSVYANGISMLLADADKIIREAMHLMLGYKERRDLLKQKDSDRN